MNILIVDDDYVDREEIKHILSRTISQCNFVEKTSVDDAIEELKKNKFDIVLSDYRMPQKDGIELLIEIKNLKQSHSVAVILLSNSEDDELALSCIKAGAHDFLMKSEVTSSRLHRAISQARERFELEQKLLRSYQEVKQLAEIDALSGLANRYLFEKCLRSEISDAARSQERVALLLFDLDHFKYINDHHGNDFGDLFLKRVVNRINGCLRGNEVFARIGGDEFAIILKNVTDLRVISMVAQRILRVLEKPFHIGETILKISASIGLSTFPENANNSDDLFKFADIAMYRAKKNGRNQLCFFESKMQADFIRRYDIENQLKDAISNNEFIVFYQPVISPLDDKVLGVEALVRWESGKKLIMPDEFIGIAEESGLIIDIGRMIIEETFMQLAKWQKLYSSNLTMAINLSAVQLGDDKLPEFIAEQISKNNLYAPSIEFELTETAFIQNPNERSHVIHELKQLGCSIALDDFGTGFSSLSHLQNLPIDVVKIDKSLMFNYEEKRSLALIKGLTAMLKSLELIITAEGVEDIGGVELCKNLEIERIQGYYYSKPMLPELIESDFLKG
ncbi:two-component system response regulator [Aliikangiella sp. IMCC44632]